MPSKNEHRTLTDHSAKIGEPVPRGVVDTSNAEVGVPAQADFNAKEEIGKLHQQIAAMREQVSSLAGSMKSGARRAARQTGATVKLYPLSTLFTVAAIAGAVAFTMAIPKAAPRRSRYDRTLDELREAYSRIRDLL